MKTDKSTIKVVAMLAITAIVGFLFEGENVAFAESHMCFISGLIGAGISAIGGAVSAAVSAAQAKKAREANERGQAYLDDWYNEAVGTNILDRADTQSMLANYRDVMNEQSKKYVNNAIKGGATEEGKVAYAQAQNKGYADAISKIAAQGQAYKDRVSEQYMQGKMAYNQQLADQYMQSGQQMGNALSSAFNSSGSAVSGMKLG